MLKVENIRTAYHKIEALRGVSLDVNEGEIVCLIGSNGAGKSTTLMSISGVQPCHQGKILFQSESIESLNPYHIVRKGIVQVPEGRRIFPTFTVQENILIGAYKSQDSQKIRSNLERMFSLFPILKTRAKQVAGTLSGGEQQMLAIARGLMAEPKLLLLDEPSLGLAPLLVQAIFKMIKKINEEEKTSILLVEQNAKLALKNSHRAYVMEHGDIVLHGQGEELLEHPKVKQAYLGIVDE